MLTQLLTDQQMQVWKDGIKRGFEIARIVDDQNELDIVRSDLTADEILQLVEPTYFEPEVQEFKTAKQQNTLPVPNYSTTTPPDYT